MAEGQPAESEVQLLGDTVEPVKNLPVGQDGNKNAAQPQELEVVVFQLLFDTLLYVFLSVVSLRFSHRAKLRDC